MICPFACNEPPEGWLICDGRELSRLDYSELFNVIGTIWGVGDGLTTFNIPDLRNEFIRGASNTRLVGSSEGHSLEKHIHYTGTSTNNNLLLAHEGIEAVSGRNESTKRLQLNAISGSGFLSAVTSNPITSGISINGFRDGSLNTMASISDETRPRNKTVLFCIKYTNNDRLWTSNNQVIESTKKVVINDELDVSGDINLTGNLLQNGSNYNPIINSVDTLERQYNITLEDMFKTLFSNYLPINNLYSAFTTFVPIYSSLSNGLIFLNDSNLPSFMEIDYELKPEYGYGFKIQFYVGGGGDYRSIGLTDFLMPNKRLSLRIECLGSSYNLFVTGRTINSGTYLDMWNNSNSITISSSTRKAVALNLVSTTNREFRSIGGNISTYFNVFKIRGFR